MFASASTSFEGVDVHLLCGMDSCVLWFLGCDAVHMLQVCTWAQPPLCRISGWFHCRGMFSHRHPATGLQQGREARPFQQLGDVFRSSSLEQRKAGSARLVAASRPGSVANAVSAVHRCTYWLNQQPKRVNTRRICSEYLGSWPSCLSDHSFLQ